MKSRGGNVNSNPLKQWWDVHTAHWDVHAQVTTETVCPSKAAGQPTARCPTGLRDAVGTVDRTSVFSGTKAGLLKNLQA